jgi:hypothetical protein
MYKIDLEKNDIIELQKRKFGDLKIKERKNLQEWIVKNPNVLGEDLLILQKEYSGFNDTKERLDILALDKHRQLVIIENKLDDSGRDVVWQALKYTSYCSTLKNDEIIKMFQQYLDSCGEEKDAKEVLLEFLEIDESELLLNDKDQRMILVANEFRKEVTSTVLWLLDHEINVQCFRATPYSHGEATFLQIQQIIPLPETSQFMIDAREKEKEEAEISKTVAASEARLIRFWGLLKKRLEKENLRYLDNVTPRQDTYISFTKGPGSYGFCIGRKAYRVELYFYEDGDKRCFEEMKKYEQELDDKINDKLQWERLDNRIASRLKLETKDLGSFRDEDNWDKILDWYVDSMRSFYDAVDPIWNTVQKKLRQA